MQPSPGDELKSEQKPVPHDCFREVYLGQISEPLYPPHPEPPEAEEDELTRAALADPGASHLEDVPQEPTVWRVVVVILFAVLALGVVFILK